MTVLAVIGSRGFSHVSDVVPYGIATCALGVTELVSGGARGVDRTAEEYARDANWRVVSYRPLRHGAGYAVRRLTTYGEDVWIEDSDGRVLIFPTFADAAKRRNWWIVRDADFVLAFWDGMSSGTAHGIAAASRYRRGLRIWMDGDS